MGRIVVGVDGSAHSRAALEWAIEQARRSGSTIDAVLAWSDPYVNAGAWAGAMTVPGDLDKIAESHRDQLREIVEAADTSGLEQPIEQIVAMGGATSTLLDVAKGAEMVVVGSRGHGGFIGLVLGSVSQQVATHATCPVVIVPGSDRSQD